MKVLIISFDKTLSDKLKEILSKQHEVFTAKNTEEALTLIPPEIDVIIFDAISGAISEEEINQLYNKKFTRQKYIVLYDELFPVDENNIQPPDKILVIRDRALEEVPKLVEGTSPEETRAVEQPIPEMKTEVSHVETPKGEVKSTGKPKVLIVSFDKKLTDELEEFLKDKYETEVVKNQRLVKEKGKEADLIIFDAISGTIAEKNLMELSEDPVLREKYYLILIDDLFPINVDKLNLPNKEVVNRDAPANLIAENVESILQKFSAPVSVEESQPSPPPKAEEEIPEEELIQGNVIDLEEEKKTKEEVKPFIEDVQEVHETKLQPVERTAPPSGTLQTNVGSVEFSLDEKTVKTAIIEAIAKELAGLREEVKMEVSGYIRDVIESVVREEVEKYLLELKIGDLIKEETRRIVEEKLKELLS